MIIKKVALGLSGGVDSSVAAVLLMEQGYEVTGVYLECYNEPGCRTDQDKADALKVALKLGIPFKVLDFRKEYKVKVIEYFYSEYREGRTPNPDVMCNSEIKFGIFYDWSIQSGYDYVATGHYARIDRMLQSSSNPARLAARQVFQLLRAKDESKDQSYFLWQIPSGHLPHILFPLGEMLKSEVRAKAKNMNLVTASKPDSMGICFIGDVDVSKLLKDRLGEDPGEVVLQYSSTPVIQYASIGTHRGLWFYTIGERGGFEIDKNKLKKMGMHPEKMKPLYVIAKNIENNTLIVGERGKVLQSEFGIQNAEFDHSQKLWVRIRNLGELYEVDKIEGNKVFTKQPLYGVAEGQSAVFYDENKVLVAGSIIV